MENNKPFDQWCLLEIMGHQKFAGRVTEIVIAGQAFIRIDVPEITDATGVVRTPGFTKLFGPSSVYAITPVVEEVARAMARQIATEAITIYDLPADWRTGLRELQRIETSPRIDDNADGDDEPF